jgi:site-specific DNA recombinase
MAVDWKALEKAKKSTKAVAYSRVSTIGQVDKVSLQYQEEKIKGYADWQGYSLVDSYIEKGESGAKEDRTQLTRLLTDAEEGKFDLVIVYKPDRLSRDFRIAFETMYKLEDLGVGIIFLEPFIDTRDQMGKLIFSFMSHFAEMDKNNIVARLNMGRKDKVKRGNWISKKPYGYDVINGKLVTNKTESEAVRAIFKLRAYDRMSLRAIAEYLNKQGYSTPTGKSNKWNHNSVNLIIKNELYAGKCTQEISGEIIEIDMDYEPLTTYQMFGRANSKY